MTFSGWLAMGAALGGIGVALGAFGAHGLKSRVGSDLLAIFETGVRYHLVHALALIAVAWVAERYPGVWTAVAGWGFVVGILVFSGSLYAMTLTGQRWLGAITPIGGVSFLVGWAALLLAALKSR